jgi:hypothetical protein
MGAFHPILIGHHQHTVRAVYDDAIMYQWLRSILRKRKRTGNDQDNSEHSPGDRNGIHDSCSPFQ